MGKVEACLHCGILSRGHAELLMLNPITERKEWKVAICWNCVDKVARFLENEQE
jgi:hypothetical protein